MSPISDIEMGRPIKDVRIVLGALLFSVIQYADEAFQRRVEDSETTGQLFLLVRQILGLRIRFSKLILLK